MSEQALIVSCPGCGATVPWGPQSRYRPFCSERCKMIDLGQWASESYRMPAVETMPDGEDSGSRES
ncbi:DNA gyrase inhibitor YacG [Paludibacterium paludis]|uniref:DNA gyrase inhibitor YacG n=1 Tax=Paludibacterium paludis TaxID=1225769 RepID=A0A918NZB4_9NEIS|nr:DNA gyrase inhibitor YacG [Paludibacterium paludis]GGY08192.1 hypothetical protein GCM10011289_08580 [Paludibacterium paludis]